MSCFSWWEVHFGGVGLGSLGESFNGIFLREERALCVIPMAYKGATCGFGVRANWVNLGLSQRADGLGRSIWCARGCWL